MGHRREENAKVQRWAGANVTSSRAKSQTKKQKTVLWVDVQYHQTTVFWPEFDARLADLQPSRFEAL
jgi:hypothetical protein